MKDFKIGYTTGVFDMFHVGHLNILSCAKELCDVLVVGVSTDELVEEYKCRKPVIPYEERASIVEAIKYVDRVVPQSSMDKLSAVKAVGADVVFVGSDWKDSPQWIQYEKAFSTVGCRVIYLPHTEGISSTILRERLNLK